MTSHSSCNEWWLLWFECIVVAVVVALTDVPISVVVVVAWSCDCGNCLLWLLLDVDERLLLDIVFGIIISGWSIARDCFSFLFSFCLLFLPLFFWRLFSWSSSGLLDTNYPFVLIYWCIGVDNYDHDDVENDLTSCSSVLRNAHGRDARYPMRAYVIEKEEKKRKYNYLTN